MKNRWLNLLFFLLMVLIVSLSWHLFVFAKATAAASLIINILKPLNILLFVVLFFVLSRNLVKLYRGRKVKAPGFRLRTRLVLAILPLTLAPALLLFTFATRYLDDLLYNVALDPNIAKIVETSDALNEAYLQELDALHRAHGPEVMRLMEQGDRPALASYLNRFGLQGVERFQDGSLRERVLGSHFPSDQIARLERSVPEENNGTSILFGDGWLLARFPFSLGSDSLNFLFAKGTPFTEKYLFVRDSYSYLKHAERKTEKVKGLNQGILLIATLSVIFGGIWVGLAFANRFLAAFNVLIAGAQQVSKGNFETQIALETGDEIEDVVEAFNSMTQTLKSNQAELEQKAVDLQRLNRELSGQIQYNQTLLQQINAGIISTGEDHRVETINPAARQILAVAKPEPGASFEQILDATRHRQLREQWESFQTTRSVSFRQLELVAGDGAQTMYVACSIVPLLKEGTPFGSIIVLEDLTQLLKAQKLAAWQEVAKRVAHEIKNPLTPIQLSIQRIQRKAATDAGDLKEAIQSAYETVMSETQLLKNLVNEFSTFAKMPAPSKAVTDLGELVKSVCESYDAVYENIHIRTDLPEGDFRAACDASQMRQVLTNLIQNAANATQPTGEVVVSLARTEGKVTLAVSDTGIGISRAERDQVFIPYYSKSPKGTGLGLAIVKRIVEDHGGDIAIESNHPRGTRFKITLPLD